MVEFRPAYLSGFYADVSDVDSSVYEQDARDAADEWTFQRLSEKARGMNPKTTCSRPADLDQVFHTKLKGTVSTMMPVWFLT